MSDLEVVLGYASEINDLRAELAAAQRKLTALEAVYLAREKSRAQLEFDLQAAQQREAVLREIIKPLLGCADTPEAWDAVKRYESLAEEPPSE